MKIKIFIFLTLKNLIITEKILTSFKVIRHGSRISNDNPVKNWYKNKGYIYPGQLTDKGKIQNYELGEFYSKFDNFDLKNDTGFFSSNRERCVESGENFIFGYFNKILNKININVIREKEFDFKTRGIEEMEIEGNIDIFTDFENENLIEENIYQNINKEKSKNIDKTNDNINKNIHREKNTNKKNNKKIENKQIVNSSKKKKLQKKVNLKLKIFNKHFLHYSEVRNSKNKLKNHMKKEADKRNEEISKLYKEALKYNLEKISKIYCKKCNLKKNSPFNKVYILKRLYTIYNCNNTNNIHHIENFKYDKNLLEKLKIGFKLYYKFIFTRNNFARNYAKNKFLILKNQILSFFKKNKKENYIKKHFFENLKNFHFTNKNIFIFAHNTNVLSIIFNLFEENFIFKSNFDLVPFIGSIQFDLVESFNNYYFYTRKGSIFDYFVKISYLHKEIFITFCNNERCFLNKFLEFLDNVIN